MQGSAVRLMMTGGRSWLRRLFLSGLLLAAFGMMMLAKADVLVFEKLQILVADSTVLILEVLVEPAAVISKTADVIRSLWLQQDEIQRLQQEVEKLRKWQRVAESLERENVQLRDLLRFAPNPAPREVMAARVITDHGVFRKSKLVNAGSNLGVMRGQIAMTGDAVVGRVVSVGKTSARILLITDINSRIPVVVINSFGSRVPAIMAGDNSDHPILRFLPDGASLMVGDQIVTSGTGGLFQPGLPVGRVQKIIDNDINIQLYSDLNRLEMVRLIDFGLDRLFDLQAVPPEKKKTPSPPRQRIR